MTESVDDERTGFSRHESNMILEFLDMDRYSKYLILISRGKEHIWVLCTPNTFSTLQSLTGKLQGRITTQGDLLERPKLWRITDLSLVVNK